MTHSAAITLTLFALLLSACAVPAAAIPTATSGPVLPAASATVAPASPTVAPSALPPTAPPASPIPVTATAAPLPTQPPLAPMTLGKGDLHFSVGGREGFFFSRNLTSKTAAGFDSLLESTKTGGSRIIRLHLTHGWWGEPWITATGGVNEAWAHDWEGLFDKAAAEGIYIIPVFGVWADWNNGAPDYSGALWQYNPLNSANGGPVFTPGELFKQDSTAQKLWLDWVGTLATRWQSRTNIAAWEAFSEINIVSGPSSAADSSGAVTQTAAEYLATRAAGVIREADSLHRPVTTSLAGVYSELDAWARFYTIDAVDFVEIHPYTESLDRDLITGVRQKLARYGKPVLIGESGLYAYPHARGEGAHLAIRHAIWASIVSGALNGRALWDEDGYATYWPSEMDPVPFLEEYKAAESAAATFVQDIDFAGLVPLTARFSNSIFGGAIGGDKLVVGWVREAGCEPPNWNLQPAISGQNVTMDVPGNARTWRVTFYNTETGAARPDSIAVSRSGRSVVVSLPVFADALAFQMVAEE